MRKHYRVMELLAFLLWLFIAIDLLQQKLLVSSQPNNEGCSKIDLDTHSKATCAPCEMEKWFDLILNQRAGTDKETSCFNDFPLGTNLPFSCPQDLTKGNMYPELDLTKTPRGFIMSKLPFFRYNTKLTLPSASDCVCPMACLPPPPGSPGQPPEENLDIGEVEHYYSDVASGYNVDFQVLEWPGRLTADQHTFLTKKLENECKEGDQFKSHKPYLCTLPKDSSPNSPNKNFQMLKFQRMSSKILHYPCNREEGTSIVALGLMAVYDETESDDHPHSKVFLSYGNVSIFNTHGHPLYVSEAILNEMAKDKDAIPKGICRKAPDEPQDCDFTRTLVNPLPHTAGDCDWRQKFFEDRGDIIIDQANCQDPPPGPPGQNCDNCRKIKKSFTGDLRTVLDFTFVQGRLLLGMRCGVLIVKDFLNKLLDIKPASLISSVGQHKNTFPPINQIASSFCCKTTGCRRTIVAAYSSYQHRRLNTPKELFISFDLGETFQVKLLAEHTSALNLMWGMYKLYGSWLLYYQLLENPDPEDLRDDRGDELHPGYIELRSVPDWDSLTLAMKEKRFLYGETTSESHMKDLEVRKRALRRYARLRTAGALARFVRYRRLGKEIDLDLTPEWLQNEVGNIRSKSKTKWKDAWTDSNCDSVPECRNNYVNDPAVAYFLNQADIIVKTPKKPVEEVFCDQVMSIVVLEEEDSLYVLCRVGFGDFSMPFDNSNPTGPISCSSRETPEENLAMPNCTYPIKPIPNIPIQPTNYGYNPCVNPIKYYAIFSFSVKQKLPLVLFEEMRSERLFTCKPITVSMDWDGCKNIYARPELVRVPSSVSLLIKNCKDVLYYSPNGGRTVFNTQFYAHHSQFSGPVSFGSSCIQHDDCNLNYTGDHRQLMYRLKALDVPPLIAVSRSNTIVFMTMKNMYAYGLMGVNKEFKMIVGEIFPNISKNVIDRIRSNDFVFPGFTYSGKPFFGVTLKLVYSHNQPISCSLYTSRHGMRLVHMDFFFYKDVSYYYEENQDLDSEARASDLDVRVCNTYQFSANPNNLLLDVDETGVVEVTSYDPQPNIHLGLVSSEEKSIIVDVSFVDRQRKDKEHLAHDWDIHVKAIRNYKPRITALVDSFFGAENNNMFGFYTEIGLANNVAFRCHVQPAATVSVHIECRDKRLVAHEDEHRPQCIKGKFSKSAFEYRIKKGEFDPNLAGYWTALDEQEGKELIKLDRATGDLVIVYDYLRFGCPLEPYKDEPFIPDLRIATADTKYNSSLGELYNGSFLLIELFGATGFFFGKTYRDYECTYLPTNVSELIQDWVHRQRMFRIAYGKQTSVSNLQTIIQATTLEELDKLEFGDRLFIPDAVDHPINIVNRVTYRDCKKWRNFFLETENKSYPRLDSETEEKREATLNQPLQIMERDGLNKITWSKRSQQVYIFMAIALDPTESLCEYYTIFGVHLPELTEIDSLITLLVFIFLILLWILLFVCGYLCRKSRIRTLCIELERKRRLEEAAWKVVYEYEKLLQENENRQFVEEFRQFHEDVEMMESGQQKPPDNTNNEPTAQARAATKS